MANTQEKTKTKEAAIQPLGTSAADLKKQLEQGIKTNEELQAKIAAFEEQEALKKAEAKKRQKEETTKQKFFNLALEAGFVLPGNTEETEAEMQNEDKFKVSTFQGIRVTLGIFVALIGVFFLYSSFTTLNDSEERMSNAAFSHIMSHTPIVLVVIVVGGLVQFLWFNQQFRYLVTNINSKHSFQEDFKLATPQASIRMRVALFTFAFPTGVAALLMLLILG